jgi:hypothetical protein
VLLLLPLLPLLPLPLPLLLLLLLLLPGDAMEVMILSYLGPAVRHRSSSSSSSSSSSRAMRLKKEFSASQQSLLFSVVSADMVLGAASCHGKHIHNSKSQKSR